MFSFRKRSNIIRQLMKHSKNGDKKQFFELADSSGLFNNLSSLNSVESSKLIYSFSNLKIQDKQIWGILENLFLMNEKKMNMHDYVMCTWSFQKTSKNPVLWNKIEEAIGLNFMDWKQDQQKNPNLGLAVYSFAMNQRGTEKTWQKFLLIAKETLPYLDERNLVLVGYSFCKKKINDNSFWNLFEKVLLSKYSKFKFINQITIVYSFSISKQGSDQFWEQMEKPFLVKDVKQCSKRDVVQILFSFARISKGSPEFWNKMQQAIQYHWDDFTFTDLNQIAYSMYLNSQGSEEFWQFFKEKKFTFQASTRHPYSTFNELIFLGRILKKKQVATPEVLNILVEPFKVLLNKPGVLLNSTAPISYHTNFYLSNPELFTPKVEKLYIEHMQQCFSNSNSVELVTHIINYSYFLTDMKLGSQEIWTILTDFILQNGKDLMKKADTRRLRGLASSMYICTNLNKYSNNKLVEQFDQFCSSFMQCYIYDYRCTGIMLRCFSRSGDQNNLTFEKVFKHVFKQDNIKNEHLFLLMLFAIERNGFQIKEDVFLEFRDLVQKSLDRNSQTNEKRIELGQIIKKLASKEIEQDQILQIFKNIEELYMGKQFEIIEYLEQFIQLDQSQESVKLIKQFKQEQENEQEFRQFYEKQQDSTNQQF